MITVNFVDSVQKTFNGDSIVWVAGANIIDVIKELAEKYNLDPYSIANFRYVVNGKDIPQKSCKRQRHTSKEIRKNQTQTP